MMFGAYVLLGVRHAGYVIGLLATLGVVACAVALVCLLAGYLANPDDHHQKEDDE